MAQTVGYPCAIAAHLVLEGQITQPGQYLIYFGSEPKLLVLFKWSQFSGMVTPLAKEIYKPILTELEKLGITARRTVSSQY